MTRKQPTEAEVKAALEVIFARDSQVYQDRGFHAPGRLRQAAGADQHRPGERLDARGQPVHLRRHGRDHPGRAEAARGVARARHTGRLHLDGLQGAGRAEQRRRPLGQEDPDGGPARGLGRTPRLDDRIAPQPGEQVIIKKRASAFHGTYLSSFLKAHGVHTVIVTGVTMAGCVRHTVEDAIAEGFRPIVVRECVGDRVWGVTEWNLFDIDAKFGDVEKLDTVLDYLHRIENEPR